MNRNIMLQRNRIYTGIIRAKKIHVVGAKNALVFAGSNLTVDKRNSLLKVGRKTIIRSETLELFMTVNQGGNLRNQSDVR